MNARHNGGPTDISTPCPECGGGTYTFASGSVWCPSETCQPGGRFIVRVAFERSPADTGVLPLPYPKRERKAKPSIAAQRAAIAKPQPKVEDVFASGFDAFIGDGK